MTFNKIQVVALALGIANALHPIHARASDPAPASKSLTERQIASWGFDAPTSLQGWKVETPTKTTAAPTWTLDNERPHSGAGAARLQVGADAGDNNRVFSPPLRFAPADAADELRPGRVLEISLSVRADNVTEGNAQIAMLEQDATGKVIGWVGGGRVLGLLPVKNEWQEAHFEARLSPRARSAVFFLWNTNKTPSTLWIDDVSFKLKEPLSAPGPEAGQNENTGKIAPTVAVPAPAQDAGTEAIAALPVRVAPDNTNLHYSGRFDLRESALAKCSWSASAITLRFRGTAVNANLGLGENHFTVVLDGQPVKQLAGKAGDSKELPQMRLYSAATGLTPGEHTVALFKNTEPLVGDATFGGFQLSADSVALPVPLFQRKIEVIGDSISAGYGIEGANRDEHFKPATENAYRAYGAIAARAVGADYTCIAWSGRTLWPTNTIPEIYNRVLPRSPEPTWAGPAPDVYVINLATNDFGKRENPEEDGWVNAYHSFISQLRQKAPQAHIYCTLGPMLTDAWPLEQKRRTNARRYLERVVRESNAAGDQKVRFLEFDVQNLERNGSGSDWHPSLKTNEIMAQKLVAALQADLAW
jgi:lysophospholipase L1-like esterase